MAKSPQLENGLTPIANELVEAFSCVNLSAYEARLIWFIIRKTYGYHKKTDRISYSQFEGGTGIDHRHIGRTLKSLLDRKIILCTGAGYMLEYGIQKDYDLWKNSGERGNKSVPIAVLNSTPKEALILTPKKAPIENINQCLSRAELTPKEGESVPLQAPNLTPKEAHTKERSIITKDILQKKEEVGGGGRSVPKKSLQIYREELAVRFGDLDFATEYEKYLLYWFDGRRKCKNPKLALLNWMVKAREIKKERENDGRLHGQMAARNAGQGQAGATGIHIVE